MMQLSSDISEDQLASLVADKLVQKAMPVIEELVKKYHEPDKGLDQAGAAEVLGCGTDTLMNYYIHQPGFPHFMKNTKISFSRKAIEKWMAENQIYA